MGPLSATTVSTAWRLARTGAFAFARVVVFPVFNLLVPADSAFHVSAYW